MDPRARPTRSRGRGLTFTLSAAFGALAGLTLMTAGALIAITTEMHTMAGRLQRATSAVRELESAQASLLLGARSRDAVALVEVERLVARGLATAEPFAPVEVARARSATGTYFSALRADGQAGDGAIAAAYSTVRVVSEQTAAIADEAQAALGRWDRTANVLGFGSAALLVLASSMVLWWVRRRAFRPLLSLAQAMDRFAKGDEAARAACAGPVELAAMAEQFNAMAEAHARRRESQLAFLAGVAHDLRNPLSAIRLAVRRLRPVAQDAAARSRTGDERVTEATTALVERQVARLERMLTDLVDGARVHGGHLDLRREEVDLARLSADAVSLFADVSPIHRVRLSGDAARVLVHCDPARIEQVLVNLLSNAIKYSPAGGLVSVECGATGDSATVCVTDEGVGVSPGEAEVIFEPFRRSERTRDLPGSGLGLSVVKRIVEAHGGTIHVAPRREGGTAFSFVLPRRMRSARAGGDVANG